MARPLTIEAHGGFTGLGNLVGVSELLRAVEPCPEAAAERRASRRVRVTCAATLQTMTTFTHGTLGDISETGARFEADEPPGKGATALLRWGGHEAVCSIIWHDDGACGVWFKQPLAALVVEETAAMDRVVEMPIASVGNIVQGRKRGAGLFKRAVVEEGLAADAAPPFSRIPLPETTPAEVCEARSAIARTAEPDAGSAAETPAFGRAGGLAPPHIGHSETLAAVLRRFRRTGSWED